MTFLKDFFDKIAKIILDDKKSLNIEESVKIGSIKPSKLEKKKIKKVLFCLDLTSEVVLHAIDNNIDIIFVHQAFGIWENSKIQDELISLIKILIEKNIYLFFFQKNNLINNKLNEFLVAILNGEVDSTFNVEIHGEMVPVGRIARLKVAKMSVKSFLDYVTEKLNLKHVQYFFSESNAEIDNFLILAGIPVNHEILKSAKKQDLKTILGEGLNFEILHYCQFYEMNFIDITRYALIKALKHLINLLKFEFIDVEFSIYEKEFLFSIHKK
ncbi:MAG: hypothetical protein EAX96_08790 [Candidatus Lokiarchaeota archaeon]|nr:hypothetical protein [Candidatus Lokiarchaeota archaeon]